MLALIRGSESIIGGHHGLAIGAGEVHRAHVSSCHITEVYQVKVMVTLCGVPADAVLADSSENYELSRSGDRDVGDLALSAPVGCVRNAQRLHTCGLEGEPGNVCVP